MDAVPCKLRKISIVVHVVYADIAIGCRSSFTMSLCFNTYLGKAYVLCDVLVSYPTLLGSKKYCPWYRLIHISMHSCVRIARVCTSATLYELLLTHIE